MDKITVKNIICKQRYYPTASLKAKAVQIENKKDNCMEKLNGNHKCVTSFPKDVVGTQALQASRQDPWSYMQVRAS